MENFYKRISMAQAELKAPKSQYNSFGKYNYRSCEDILEAAKPICQKYSLLLILTDEIENIGARYYVKATAMLFDTESDQMMQATASAREADTKKGMDDSQVTGTASSYARKYALNGLFNIDDTKDADTDEYTKRTGSAAAGGSRKQQPPKQQPKPQEAAYKCADCGKEFQPFTDKNGKTWSAAEVYAMSQQRNPDGVARCADCRKKKEGQGNGTV